MCHAFKSFNLDEIGVLLDVFIMHILLLHFSSTFLSDLLLMNRSHVKQQIFKNVRIEFFE